MKKQKQSKNQTEQFTHFIVRNLSDADQLILSDDYNVEQPSTLPDIITVENLIIEEYDDSWTPDPDAFTGMCDDRDICDACAYREKIQLIEDRL